MQPHGRGARPAVVGKENGAGAPIPILLHVGRVTEMGDHLALVVLHFHSARGGAVLDGFAVDAHLTLALRVQKLRNRLLGLINLIAMAIGEDTLGRDPGEEGEH